MKDNEIWLVLFQSLVSISDYPIASCAVAADEALLEYKKRWEDKDNG